jgi:hypothetical protein
MTFIKNNQLNTKFFKECCDAVEKFYSQGLPLLMNIMKLSIPQSEQMFPKVYESVFESFVSVISNNFEYGLMRNFSSLSKFPNDW